VYINGAVHMKTRQFDPKFYDCVSIPCTTIVYAKTLDYCTLRSSEMQRFSLSMSLGTKFAPLRFASSGTFCSKLCAEALQEADVLGRDLSAATITPSGLHRLPSPSLTTARSPRSTSPSEAPPSPASAATPPAAGAGAGTPSR
jgi:hypothetical protein